MHLNLIDKLVEDRQQLLNRITSRLRNLEEFLNGAPDLQKYYTVRGVVGTNLLVSHYTIQGSRIGMDLAGCLTGWKLNLHQCEEFPPTVMRQLINNPLMKQRFPALRDDSDCCWLQEWDAHTSELELQDALFTSFQALIAAADEISNQPD